MRFWRRQFVAWATVVAVSCTPVIATACALFCGPLVTQAADLASGGHANPGATPAIDAHAGHHASHMTPAAAASRSDVRTAADAARPQVAANGTRLTDDACCPVVSAAPAEPVRGNRDGVQVAGTTAVQPDILRALLTSSSTGQALRPPRHTRPSVLALLPLRI